MPNPDALWEDIQSSMICMKNHCGILTMSYNLPTMANVSSLSTKHRRTTNEIRIHPEAELLNARAAMIGFIAAVGSYFTTGQIIPGYSDVSFSSIDDWRIYIMVSPLC